MLGEQQTQPEPAAAESGAQSSADQFGVELSGRPVQIELHRRPLTVLVIKNLILTIVTLGLYRFWARTNYRRKLWSAVKIDGTSVEYTGTGLELFLGFLYATVIIIAPLLLFLAGVGVIPVTGLQHSAVSFACSAAGYVLVLPLAQFYARRYRLSRTSWLGIRASQDADLKDWMRKHCRWQFIEVITLGLAVPWTSARRYEYRMRHTLFGTARFTATIERWPIVRSWLPAWAFLVAVVAIYYLDTVPSLEAIGAVSVQDKIIKLYGLMEEWVGGFGLALGGVIYMYFLYIVKRARIFLFGTTIGELSLISCGDIDLSYKKFLFLFYGFNFFVLIKWGLYFVENPVLSSFLYLTFVLFIFYLTFYAVMVPIVLREIGSALRIIGLPLAPSIMNRAERPVRRGEGVADVIGDVAI
jgi:hypothetical protein